MKSSPIGYPLYFCGGKCAGLYQTFPRVISYEDKDLPKAAEFQHRFRSMGPSVLQSFTAGIYIYIHAASKRAHLLPDPTVLMRLNQMVVMYRAEGACFTVPVKGGIKKVMKADEGLPKIIDKINFYELRQTFQLELTRFSLGDIVVTEGWLNRGGRKTFVVCIELGVVFKPVAIKEEAKKMAVPPVKEETKKIEEAKKLPPAVKKEDKKPLVEEVKKKSKELPTAINDVNEMFGLGVTVEYVEWLHGLWREYGIGMENVATAGYNEKHAVVGILAGALSDLFPAKPLAE